MDLGDKIKVSKKDFAETLYYWLSEHLTEREVKAMAGEIGFSLKGFLGIRTKNTLYTKFYGELFILNMYLIVLTCRGVMEDKDQEDAILEIFHDMVYHRNIHVTGASYDKWITFMHHMYDEYGGAMESESLLTPLLLVSEKFEKNLFGKKRLGPYVKFEFSMRIGGMVKHLSQVVRGYDIE